MSFLSQFAELLLLSVVAFDTLGFIAEQRKNSSKSENKDFVRLCFTWVFFLVLRALTCSVCCLGYFGSFIGMLAFFGKVYISIPAIGGTETLYSMLIEQNIMKRYLCEAYTMVKSKTCSQ